MPNRFVSIIVKHPVLPSKHHVTRLIIEDHHRLLGHSGMSNTWTSLRQRFWVIKGALTVRGVLGKCIFCRKRNRSCGQQLMAELPQERLTPFKPSFYFSGVDYFGPFYVKQGRSTVKRYGCLFTCLNMRAVHIEVAADLTTNSFINALRRFIGRRGQPRAIFSDNGTNFVGAEKELREAVRGMSNQKIHQFLLRQQIDWHFNPPSASHFGGVWERLIRSTRRILSALISQQVVSDDTLTTLMVEVESIMNSRPLTPILLDPKGDLPLTPNHLLLLRNCDEIFSNNFSKTDCYSKRRWRQVQYLAQEFWRRWSSEYIQNLQVRSKWQHESDHFKVDNIVLVCDENAPRGSWPLGRVTEVIPDRHNKVQQVYVKTQFSILKRPITKLYKILGVDEKDRDDV